MASHLDAAALLLLCLAVGCAGFLGPIIEALENCSFTNLQTSTGSAAAVQRLATATLAAAAVAALLVAGAVLLPRVPTGAC
uniref:Uncharacterized protein n=1 Tax=Oryza nivara TaxID=4536 RepID=A0A0E0HM92_ORYNI